MQMQMQMQMPMQIQQQPPQHEQRYPQQYQQPSSASASTTSSSSSFQHPHTTQQYQSNNYNRALASAFPHQQTSFAATTPSGGSGGGFRGPQSAGALVGERTNYGMLSGGGGGGGRAPISLPYTAEDTTPASTSTVVARLPVVAGELMSVKFPARPENGSRGRIIQVRANFFEFITLPGQDLFHYDVRITPEVPPSLNRKIFRDLEAQCGVDKLGGVISVYDGRRNLYTP